MQLLHHGCSLCHTPNWSIRRRKWWQLFYNNHRWWFYHCEGLTSFKKLQATSSSSGPMFFAEKYVWNPMYSQKRTCEGCRTLDARCPRWLLKLVYFVNWSKSDLDWLRHAMSRLNWLSLQNLCSTLTLLRRKGSTCHFNFKCCSCRCVGRVSVTCNDGCSPC